MSGFSRGLTIVVVFLVGIPMGFMGMLWALDLVGEGPMRNLALDKRTQQSSLYDNSEKSQSGGGVDGVIDGTYGFSTAHEAKPWWQVDLGGLLAVREIRVHNRTECCRERAKSLLVLVSPDGKSWQQVYSHAGKAPFGSKMTGDPLTIRLPSSQKARYVRVQLSEPNYLHLDEVEVYGPSR